MTEEKGVIPAKAGIPRGWALRKIPMAKEEISA
jgi:hypothetical protein